jgi:hypothetical protein
MVTQQLLDYIKRQTQQGKNKEEITSALLAAGWQANDVEQAFANPTGVPAPMAATELPKARQILKESWAIYKNRFKTLITIILIPTAGYLLLILLGILATSATAGLLKQGAAGVQPWKIAGIILGIIAIIFLIYLYIWATVAQLFAIKDQAQAIGWKEAYKRSKPKIGSFFSTSILNGLAVLGGTILFIIPGIIFGLWFSQSPYVVVEEGLTNTAALKRSKYYVKGRIGQIFGKLFYIGIATFALYIVLAIILGIFASITGIKYNNISWITNIFSLIWTPLVTVYSYQLYKYCKATRP